MNPSKKRIILNSFDVNSETDRRICFAQHFSIPRAQMNTEIEPKYILIMIARVFCWRLNQLK